MQEAIFRCLNQTIIQQNIFPKNLLATEMKKILVIMNKAVCLGLLVL